ncbi:uncharacterized protein [Euwallacea fornicatus]|uniref:uncharacterized protein isoform X1 n=1 Tax=Euwallacea fornicatus TaxID=995702 RepID=UPI00338F9DCD
MWAKIQGPGFVDVPRELNVSTTTLHRIPTKDSHLHSHKIRLAQRLLPCTAKRVHLLCIVEQQEMNAVLMDKIILQAHFHLDGFVCGQNCRFSGPDNPGTIREKLATMESSWTLEYRIFLDDCFVRSARVHEAKPRTLEEQKEAMPHQITEIDGDLPEGVEANFFERLQHCINFGHLPNKHSIPMPHPVLDL